MNYRELFLSGGIVVSLALPADAQDRWTGYYGGVSFNFTDTSSEIAGSSVHNLSDEGSGFGIYAGYGIRRGPNFVWTPEVALSRLETPGGASDATFGSTGFDGSFLLEPRIRAGYATQRAYYYGIVGLGITDAGLSPSGSDDDDLIGSFGLGLGAEVAINDTWSTRLEAVHYQWDASEQNFNGNFRETETDATVLRIGLTRRF
ncbi:porin family protein [Roseobacter sinensis]|uniref:Porin family protein n=1 Tax=Roseobacter sinensis TaxID=2931391 RepID=A0ABT3BHC2_9RHOB|nr:porin family protein [Roseobacter sp. WL0113]MCV3272981.1 porin family protein [Roseobacter sp. WL0113]